MNLGLFTLLVPLTVAQPEMPVMLPIAPLLAAKVVAPEGVRVTALPGAPGSKVFDAPAVFGFRPGYVYRLELANLPFRPGQTLYPEIEVRGSLVMRPGMKYMDYPIPLTFTSEDLERAVNGVAITKVISLEDPEKAVPAEARADAPIEITTDSEDEAVKAATSSGRLVAIVRFGDRAPTAVELLSRAIPGTVLLPGENRLRSPAAPPVIPWFTIPLFDPKLGPREAVEECTLDGGDRGLRLGIGPQGKIAGLDPTDVGVEFTMGGKRQVISSNVVCICVPRFVIQRAETVPAGLRFATGPGVSHHITAGVEFRARNAPMAEIGREKPIGMLAPVKPMTYVEVDGTASFVASTRPSILGQVEGVQITGSLVEPEQITAYPNVCPLSVTKSVDPADNVKQGDVIWVTLRYINSGNRPISDIVLSDSLSGRLAYIPGSALSDRAANFTTAENEAGSVVVRWEFPTKLLPGQRGVVKFQVRVR